MAVMQFANEGAAVGRVVHTYPDGSQLVEQTLVFNVLPDDTEVRLNIFVGGVTFEDGTLNKVVRADDLDPFGRYTYRLIKGPTVTTSVCHTGYVYQNNQFVGSLW